MEQPEFKPRTKKHLLSTNLWVSYPHSHNGYTPLAEAQLEILSNAYEVDKLKSMHSKNRPMYDLIFQLRPLLSIPSTRWQREKASLIRMSRLREPGNREAREHTGRWTRANGLDVSARIPQKAVHPRKEGKG